MLLTGSGHTVENLFKLIGLLAVFVVVIVACYYVTRRVGARQLTITKNSNFKILDSYKLGQNQILAIVQVGKRYFCVGITKEAISLISELDRDEFETIGEKGIPSFAGVFSSVLKKKGKQSENAGNGEDAPDDEE